MFRFTSWKVVCELRAKGQEPRAKSQEPRAKSLLLWRGELSQRALPRAPKWKTINEHDGGNSRGAQHISPVKWCANHYRDKAHQRDGAANRSNLNRCALQGLE